MKTLLIDENDLNANEYNEMWSSNLIETKTHVIKYTEHVPYIYYEGYKY